jgi:hypothetical protein
MLPEKYIPVNSLAGIQQIRSKPKNMRITPMEQKNYCGSIRRNTSVCTASGDLDAERAVLAMLLLAPGLIAEVSTALEPVDFVDPINRTT